MKRLTVEVMLNERARARTDFLSKTWENGEKEIQRIETLV